MTANKTLKKQAGIDFPGVSVCCICHDGRGNILLNKRTKKCRDEWDRWDNWGGQVEFGETFEEAIKRELLEEGGIAPLKIQQGYPLTVLRDINGVSTHWIALPFAVLIEHKNYSSGEPEKLSQVKWFSLDNLPSPRHSHFEKDIGAVRKFLNID